GPSEEPGAWNAVEEARKALAKARENLDEVKSRKSAEVCTALRAEHQRCLRDLLEKLEGVEGAFGRVATLEARIVAAGHSVRSDILGAALPPAVFALGGRDDYGPQPARWPAKSPRKGGPCWPHNINRYTTGGRGSWSR